MTYSHSDVFLDYLTVTNRPDNTCLQDVKNFLLSNGAFIDSDYNNRVSVYLDPLKDKLARVQLKEANQFVSISATGSALHYLRSHDLINDYLNILASVPHNVTRLDAALDVLADSPPVLKSLNDMYPSGTVKITQKPVPITRLLAIRDDGEETGTIYFGKRGKSRIIARIYDKAWEQLCRFGFILPSTTRYELECGRSFNTSLKDAADPYLLFWNHAHVFDLGLPDNLEPWVSAGDFSRYEKLPRATLLPLEILSRRVDQSTEINTLYHMASELGPNGLQALMRLLNTRFEHLESENRPIA